MKTLYWIVLCIALVGCQKATEEATPDPRDGKGQAGTPSAKAIGESEVRSLLSELVNAQLAGKTFADAGKQTHPVSKDRTNALARC